MSIKLLHHWHILDEIVLHLDVTSTMSWNPISGVQIIFYYCLPCVLIICNVYPDGEYNTCYDIAEKIGLGFQRILYTYS